MGEILNTEQYEKKLISFFENDTSDVSSTLSSLISAKAEIYNTKYFFEDIPMKYHQTAGKYYHHLAEKIVSCIIEFQNACERHDTLALICLEKALSEILLAGHKACEMRQNGKWKKDKVPEETEKALELYEEISKTIYNYVQLPISLKTAGEYCGSPTPQSLSFSKTFNDVKPLPKESEASLSFEKALALIKLPDTPMSTTPSLPIVTSQPISQSAIIPQFFTSSLGANNISAKKSRKRKSKLEAASTQALVDSIVALSKNTEPEVILLSDEEGEVQPEASAASNDITMALPPLGLGAGPSTAKPCRLQELASITEGCQDDEDDPPSYQAYTTIQDVNEDECLSFTNLTVGYSDAGKIPIIIAFDPNIPNRVYTYRGMIRGSYRCTQCGPLGSNRYGKLFNRVLYANHHICQGKLATVVQEQQLRRQRRFPDIVLPALDELSSLEDPRPYPALPKRRPTVKSGNPNFWDAIVEYNHYEFCLASHAGVTGIMAFHNSDHNTVYEYDPTSPGLFRCHTCAKHKKHTCGKVDESRNVFRSEIHVCRGISKAAMTRLQNQRKTTLMNMAISESLK